MVPDFLTGCIATDLSPMRQIVASAASTMTSVPRLNLNITCWFEHSITAIHARDDSISPNSEENASAAAR